MGGRLSLCGSHRLVMIPNLDPDLENVIRQALGVAKAAGRDDMGQTIIAVQAVQQARPDMTAADALPEFLRIEYSQTLIGKLYSRASMGVLRVLVM